MAEFNVTQEDRHLRKSLGLWAAHRDRLEQGYRLRLAARGHGRGADRGTGGDRRLAGGRRDAAIRAEAVPLCRVRHTLLDLLEFTDMAARLVARGRAAYDEDEALRLAAEAITPWPCG